MTEEKKEPQTLRRETNATIRQTEVTLDKLVLMPEKFCHRDAEDLHEKRLKPFLESIAVRGIEVPIEYYVEDQGRMVVTKGHRRVTALRILADRKVPGFTHDMEVPALEVSGATPQDLLVRSVSDNLNRETLTLTQRMRAAKVMHDDGVPPETSARALGRGVKTLARDLVIARHEWLLKLIAENSITAGVAIRLLDAATKSSRLKVLEEDLMNWTAVKKRLIKELDRSRVARDGKGLKQAEKEVRKYMPAHLVRHWVRQLQEGERLDENAKKGFAARIEPITGKLQIEAISLDTKTAALTEVAKVAVQLSRIAKDLMPFLKVRAALEGKERNQAGQVDETPYDIELLRENGMAAIADQLEADLHQEIDEENLDEEDEANDDGGNDEAS